MNQSFAYQLREAFDEKTMPDGRRWTQQRLAEEVSKKDGVTLSQGLVSEWLRGVTIPPSGDARIARIAEVFDASDKLADWEASIAKSEDLDLKPSPTIDRLLLEAKEHVRLAPHNLHIWILNPIHAPIVSDSRTVETWCEQLNQGVTYHLLWRTTNKWLSAVRGIRKAIVRMDKKVDSESGTIYHHPVVMPGDDPATMNALIDRLNGIKAFLSESNFGLVTVDPEPFEVEDDLRDYMSGFSTCVAYVWDEDRFGPFANVCLRKVVPPLDKGDPRSVGYWLDKDTAQDISYMLDSVWLSRGPTDNRRNVPAAESRSN